MGDWPELFSDPEKHQCIGGDGTLLSNSHYKAGNFGAQYTPRV